MVPQVPQEVLYVVYAPYYKDLKNPEFQNISCLKDYKKGTRNLNSKTKTIIFGRGPQLLIILYFN